jgi:hypothetical protein
MADHDEVELYRERLPALVEYLKGDQVRRAVESGQPIINITINEAPRPAPVTPPPPGPLAKYTEYMILYVGFAIIAGIFAVIFLLIAQAVMITMISLAVCAVAVAGAVRSLRTSRADVQMAKRRR